ncbi:MAG TPA: ATP-binding protein [Streptosporangiaceae bacterium]|nr:ATP-binding protein [Streptosporangiaceae bacterium]
MLTDTRYLLDASNYAATTHQVSLARRWVRKKATGFVDDESLYDLCCCAGELVDNARKHGRSDGAISVALYLIDSAIRLEVTNDDIGDTVPRVTNNTLTVDGHGLQIVSELAARWGNELSPEHRTQVVWCEFPRKAHTHEDTTHV